MFANQAENALSKAIIDASKFYLKQFTDVTRSLISGQVKQSGHSLPPIWLKQWAEDYLNQLYVQSGINVRLSSAALDYLATAKDYNTAKNGLEQAAKFAMMMAVGDLEKDVIIEAKYKRIAKLEAENRKLRIELEHLRGLLYG